MCLGETYADVYREDLKFQEFHPTGNCGFEFSVPDPTTISNYNFLYIRSPGAGNYLQRFRADEIPGASGTQLPKVFFMHIPKTAGTSFNTFVRTHFPENAVAIHIEESDPATYSQLQQNYLYLAGHLPLQVIKARFDVSKFDIVTMLRDPYRQLHSHLGWVKNIGTDPASEYYNNHHKLFQDLALTLNKPGISIVDDIESLTRSLPGNLASLFDNNQTRHFLHREPQKVTESDCNVAMANLACFRLVGTTERYSRFTATFCEIYDLKDTGQTDRFNQSEGEVLFNCNDEHVRLKLRPLVKYDLELYDYVVRHRLDESPAPEVFQN